MGMPGIGEGVGVLSGKPRQTGTGGVPTHRARTGLRRAAQRGARRHRGR